MHFNTVVRSEAELRELMGDPVAPPVVEKTLSSLDRHCLTFIARSPFVLIASSDAARPDGHFSQRAMRRAS